MWCYVSWSHTCPFPSCFYLFFISLWCTGLVVAGCGPSRFLVCGIFVSRLGIKPSSPALKSGFLTARLPGKSFPCFWYDVHCLDLFIHRALQNCDVLTHHFVFVYPTYISWDNFIRRYFLSPFIFNSLLLVQITKVDRIQSWYFLFICSVFKIMNLCLVIHRIIIKIFVHRYYKLTNLSIINGFQSIAILSLCAC